MNDMKPKYVASLTISYCIEFLEKRPVGTKFHPDKNKILLDGKVMTKIIRYDGNLRAQTKQGEVRYFGAMLKSIINETSVFKSITTNEKYYISENTDYNRYALEFEKTGLLKSIKGRKPQYLEKEQRENGKPTLN